MDAATRDRLLELNRAFYSRHAADFSATRQRPWQGWERVLKRVATAERRTILDLGCGNARLADACARAWPSRSWSYTGVDASSELLAEAERRLAGLRPASHRLICADLLVAEAASWAPARYALVTLFGVMHHVPGEAARRELLRFAAGRVEPGGLLAVSFWQWRASPRLVRREAPAGAAGLSPSALGPGDALLFWGDGGSLRYCHHCPADEALSLVESLGLDLVESFHADGADEAMNFYCLLRRPRARRRGGRESPSTACC